MRLKRVITTVLGAAAPVVGFARTVSASASPFAPGTGQLVVNRNKTLITLPGMPGAQPATAYPTRGFAILQRI